MRNWLIGLMLLFAATTSASVHWVLPNLSIQTAADTAAELDTILIADGFYSETVVTYGKSLTIASGYLLDSDTNHISNTVVTPDAARPDTHSCFVYAYGEDVSNRLVGLTLSYGTGTYWQYAGLLAGGGVFACTSFVSIEHCDIKHCSAACGGGVIAAFVSLNEPDSTTVYLTACRVDSCSASEIGGGLYSAVSKVFLRDSQFRWNQAGDESGGAIIMGCEAVVESCLFFACSAPGVGGMHIGWGPQRVTDCLFEGNSAHAVAAIGHLFCSNLRGVVSGCSFRDNRGTGQAIVLYSDEDDPVWFIHNDMDAGFNPVANASMTVWYAQCGEIAFNTFRNHYSNNAPAIVFAGPSGTVRVHHNVLENNDSGAEWRASVVGVQQYGCPTLDSNRIAGNGGQTVSLYYRLTDCIIDARYNWWGHASGPYHPTQNPGGQGDTLLSDSLWFIPWLTEPPDTAMPPGYLWSPRPRIEVPQTWNVFDVYPNPFNQSAIIMIEGYARGDFEIVLYNLVGQVVDIVHQGQVAGGRLYYQAPPYLSSGVYLVSAHDKHSVQTKKVVLLK